MNQMRNISVKPGVLESLVPHLTVKIEKTRYNASHAVWQLARMGAYNEAGELPLVIRLEATGDYSELYATHDRLICPVDVTDSDVFNKDEMVEALIRGAVFVNRSRRDDHVEILILTPSKTAEQSPETFSDWTIPETFVHTLKEKLAGLKSKGIIRHDTDIDTLLSKTFAGTSVLHVRRRHGHLGEEALAGKELDAVKVLQDAGINGTDLAAALTSLVSHATGDSLNIKKTGITFDRHDAMLMIRDYQRRARIERPGVRVIDQIYMNAESNHTQSTPRSPSWKQAVSHSAVKRHCFDSAVRWARLAAMKSGRGLLPVFYFSGDEGSGRSFLLKQVAWELYKEGFVVAWILNLDNAAREAESLATAAVALDAPLILVWDDAHEPGIDVLQAFREFSEAQVSGVPIMILSAASDPAYNPKKIRQLSRVSFEEFEVHLFNESDRQSMISDSLGTTDKSVDDVLPSDPRNTTPEHSVNVTDTEIAPENLQDQTPDGIVVMMSSPEADNRIPAIKAVIEMRENLSWNEYINRSVTALFEHSGDSRPVLDLMCAFGIIGFPLPENIARSICGDVALKSFRMFLDNHKPAEIASHIASDGFIWDMGHPLFVRSVVEHLNQNESHVTDLLDKAVSCMMRDTSFQSWTGRFLRALYGAGLAAETTLETLTKTVISAIQAKDACVTPVVLTDIYSLASMVENDVLQNAVIDALADYARLNAVDSFVALTPLLRNRIGGIEDTETLDILKAAKPDSDRVAFRFLLKFLSDHQPNEIREVSVDNARTAAARAPDQGFSVAAYLRFCWARGMETQIARSIDETRSWLEATPDDRIVRRAYMDYVITKASDELKRESVEPLEDWLEDHVDEGPLRNSLIELAFSLNDPAIADRILEKIARWIERRGNNRTVRQNYFRRAERRNDKTIMKRACHVAVAWLNNHQDDRETVHSLLFIASRLGENDVPAPVFSTIHTWLGHHTVERDFLRRYLLLSDKAGRGRAVTHAAEIGQVWLDQNPDDTDIREVLLGMAARKVDKKIQVRIYDRNAGWLEARSQPDPMMEYMIGRLGVRAGIPRRTIPLLERAVAGSEGDLRNHARLWLGSAYRAAEAYLDARRVWQAVKNDGNSELISRADKNLDNLENFLKDKFPKGYPPPQEKPERKKQPRTEGEFAKTHAEKPPFKHQGDRDSGPRKDFRENKPVSDRPFRQPRPDKLRVQKQESKPKAGATLGDLLRMKGLDLSNLTNNSDKKSD